MNAELSPFENRDHISENASTIDGVITHLSPRHVGTVGSWNYARSLLSQWMLSMIRT